MLNNDNKKSGFTIIELIVVIAILSLLSLILLPKILKYIGEVDKRICAENRRSLNMKIKCIFMKQSKFIVT